MDIVILTFEKRLCVSLAVNKSLNHIQTLSVVYQLVDKLAGWLILFLDTTQTPIFCPTEQAINIACGYSLFCILKTKTSTQKLLLLQRVQIFAVIRRELGN